MSLVGYDNTDLAARPALSLTSVDQGGPEMGRRAIGMLLERFGGRTEPPITSSGPRKWHLRSDRLWGGRCAVRRSYVR
ncbi:substrate-binding domain-containing protein [Streptomyces sp. NBC_00453]|uniref:substrate-binding domain-containing protein n=1 Tax=Streptomyces sp. NBC_00453 TaxID=2903653 RepID=UPI003FA71159